MLPPDIMSIDSDINKIGALTPSPFIDGPNDNFNMTSINQGLINSNQRKSKFYNYAGNSGYHSKFGDFPQ